MNASLESVESCGDDMIVFGHTCTNNILTQLAHATPFDKKELLHIRELFAKVKGDKRDDELSREEFAEVFQACIGRQLEGKEEGGVDLDEIFASMDSDHSGTVNFKEMILWLSIYNRGTEETKLRHMFEVFDSDSSGTLEASEIENVLDILKLSMTTRGVSESAAIRKAAALVKNLDKDKDGEITIEEWVSIGKEAGLVKELLGNQFMQLMDEFDPSVATAKKSKKSKKSAVGKGK